MKLFRKAVNLPASWAEKDLKLDLGPIDDENITWFNGSRVGGIQKMAYWAANRSYMMPLLFNKAGLAISDCSECVSNARLYERCTSPWAYEEPYHKSLKKVRSQCKCHLTNLMGTVAF